MDEESYRTMWLTMFDALFHATAHPLYHTLSVALYKLFGWYPIAYLNTFLLAPTAYVSIVLAKRSI